MKETEEYQESAFNLAFDSNKRVNQALIICNRCHAIDDFQGWSRGISVLLNEIWHLLDEDERKNALIKLSKVRSISEALLNKSIISGSKPYVVMAEAERFLRDLANNHGLLSQSKEDAGNVLD